MGCPTLVAPALGATGWEYEDRVGIPLFAKTGRKGGATCIRKDGRWPTQARFWLEWECWRLIQKTSNRDGEGEIESKWTNERREDSSSCTTDPLKPKDGLNGPPAESKELNTGEHLMLSYSVTPRTTRFGDSHGEENLDQDQHRSRAHQHADLRH
jgi:hypothetical protein